MTIGQVWINGVEHHDFDATNLTVQLPETGGPLKVRVRLAPTGVRFSAGIVEVVAGTATISLCGELDDRAVPVLLEQIDAAVKQGSQSIVFQAEDVTGVSAAALRALVYQKQQLGANFDITFQGASHGVVDVIAASGLGEEIQFMELTAV